MMAIRLPKKKSTYLYLKIETRQLSVMLGEDSVHRSWLSVEESRDLFLVDWFEDVVLPNKMVEGYCLYHCIIRSV